MPETVLLGFRRGAPRRLLVVQGPKGDEGVQGPPGATVASGVSFTPAGNISATTVQGALVELDTDLAAKADLVDGTVPASQLPSYVDDVLEFVNLAAFPGVGETGKIYVAKDTNLTYRWTGSAYGVLDPSLALGETVSTAYRGDRGKTAYDHSQITSGNPHGTTYSDVGADPAGAAASAQAAAIAAAQTFAAARAVAMSITLGG